MWHNPGKQTNDFTIESNPALASVAVGHVGLPFCVLQLCHLRKTWSGAGSDVVSASLKRKKPKGNEQFWSGALGMEYMPQGK